MTDEKSFLEKMMDIHFYDTKMFQIIFLIDALKNSVRIHPTLASNGVLKMSYIFIDQ